VSYPLPAYDMVHSYPAVVVLEFVPDLETLCRELQSIFALGSLNWLICELLSTLLLHI
jgi:hypothetical protein